MKKLTPERLAEIKDSECLNSTNRCNGCDWRIRELLEHIGAIEAEFNIISSLKLSETFQETVDRALVVDKAIMAERERCVKIAESSGYVYSMHKEQPFAEEFNTRLRAQRAYTAKRLRGFE